jgi:hypothetical protein
MIKVIGNNVQIRAGAETTVSLRYHSDTKELVCSMVLRIPVHPDAADPNKVVEIFNQKDRFSIAASRARGLVSLNTFDAE